MMDLAEILELAPITKLAIAMFLLLVLPRMFEHLRMPGVLGLLLSGFIFGPKALGLVDAQPEVVEFLANMGKLMVMFFAGLEVDFDEFVRHWKRSLTFGILTFLLPLLMGFSVSIFTGMGLLSAVVVGSLLASHTLVGFPVLQKKNLLQDRAVTTSIGATIFTDVASLMVLAVCVSIFTTGLDGRELGLRFLGMVIYFPVVLFCSKWIAGKFHPRLEDSEDHKTMLMIVIMASAAGIAELIHLEGIVGAFIAGLAVGEVVRGSRTQQKLETLGHTLFIPMFFLVVGAKVDPLSFTRMDPRDLAFAVSIISGLLLAKALAAFISVKMLGFKMREGAVMWSLSIPQVAATLAAALVAYDTINSRGERLLSDVVLDTALVLMAVTTILGPVLTDLFTKKKES